MLQSWARSANAICHLLAERIIMTIAFSLALFFSSPFDFFRGRVNARCVFLAGAFTRPVFLVGKLACQLLRKSLVPRKNRQPLILHGRFFSATKKKRRRKRQEGSGFDPDSFSVVAFTIAPGRSGAARQAAKRINALASSAEIGLRSFSAPLRPAPSQFSWTPYTAKRFCGGRKKCRNPVILKPLLGDNNPSTPICKLPVK